MLKKIIRKNKYILFYYLNSNKTMKSILTSHFVQSTLPKYIEEMLMNCLTNLSND